MVTISKWDWLFLFLQTCWTHLWVSGMVLQILRDSVEIMWKSALSANKDGFDFLLSSLFVYLHLADPALPLLPQASLWLWSGGAFLRGCVWAPLVARAGSGRTASVAAPQPVASSWTRGPIRVSCLGRQIRNNRLDVACWDRRSPLWVTCDTSLPSGPLPRSTSKCSSRMSFFFQPSYIV